MENLSDRFDNLQETLLDLYEKGSQNLCDQVIYWECRRKESVMLHFARKQGIGLLGMTAVPSLASSESQAKKAILMCLMLQSLQATPFADEKWSMTDCSIEVVEAAPKGMLKKGPKSVEVWFDKDPQNCFPYTLWSYIYYQSVDGQWRKAESQVDYEGIFFVDSDGEVRYYCKFGVDAARFATTGQWLVKLGCKTIYASVSSSSPEEQLRQASDYQQPTSSRESPWEDRQPTSTTPTPQQRAQTQAHRGGRSRGRGIRTPSPGQGGRRGRGGASGCGRGSPGVLPSLDLWDVHSPRGDLGGRRGRVRRGRGGRAGPPRLSPFIPIEQVGQGPGRSTGEGLRRPGEDQRDSGYPSKPPQTPVVVVKGPGNALKCWRRRVKHNHPDAFAAISTVFSWIEKDGPNRIGRHRLMIGFANEQQLYDFLDIVRLPRGCDVSKGSLDSL
uniref:Regulatory protein E2 n=1 Tax=Felis catus papillomavirus 3 TaxID=1336600 RepID=A0A2P1EPX9_9PAPI|nr:early protein 2 [Felis catus papillomavirus 3]